ncbi:MAG TPA: hypothetical protein VIR58_16560 [Acidimicrobiales bacterium]
MALEIRPESFSLVLFDPAQIRAIVERLVGEVGLPAERDVVIEIDETTPLGRSQLVSLDPITLTLESGALEDPRRPRQLDPDGATDVLGRLLFEARDRLDPEFGDPPGVDEITLPQSVAWQVHCVGRLGRLGHRVQRQRRLYQFRTRHGFTDVADAAFEQLWTADRLSWNEIDSISASAGAGVPA